MQTRMIRRGVVGAGFGAGFRLVPVVLENLFCSVVLEDVVLLHAQKRPPDACRTIVRTRVRWLLRRCFVRHFRRTYKMQQIDPLTAPTMVIVRWAAATASQSGSSVTGASTSLHVA